MVILGLLKWFPFPATYDSLFVGPDFLFKSVLERCEQTGYSSFQLCKLKRPVEIAAYVCT